MRNQGGCQGPLKGCTEFMKACCPRSHGNQKLNLDFATHCDILTTHVCLCTYMSVFCFIITEAILVCCT